MSSAEDEKVFEGAMRGIQRIGDSRQSRRSVGRKRPAPEPAQIEFSIREEGSRIYARRAATPPDELDRLRAGGYSPRNRLDLHGMTSDAARESVRRYIRQAGRSGLGCVAIVHGRGLRSAAGAVLKEQVPQWLTQLPVARDVLAFCSAPPDQGGDGALLVLLA